MTQNVSGYLPNLLGPVVLAADGVAQTPRPTINLVGFTGTDRPDLNRVDFAPRASGSLGTVSLEEKGALGKGVTSAAADQAAWVAAIAVITAGIILGPAGGGINTLVLAAGRDYRIQGGITLPAGMMIDGNGATLSTTTHGSVIVLSSSEDVYIRDLVINGDASHPAQIAIQAGISGSGLGQARLRISNVHINGTYYGMVFSRNNGGHEGPIVSDSTVTGCADAFVTQESSEFITFVNCHAYLNSGAGWRIGSGNIVVDGGNSQYNGYGVYLAVGSNDSHGIVSACNLNHNSTAGFYAEAVANGYRVVGCDLFQSPIHIVGNTKVILLEGCHLDPISYTFDNALVKMSDCTFGTDYYVSYSNLNNSDVEVVNPRGSNGPIPAHIGGLIRSTFTFSSDADKTLTKAQSRAAFLDVQAGVLSAARSLTSTRLPEVGEIAVLINRNAHDVNYFWSTGDGVVVPAGKTACIGSDGTNAIAVWVADNTLASIAAGGFSLAGLVSTLRVTSAFTASPWVGVATAGSSGSHNLTEGTHPPAAADTLNARNGADFDGALERLGNATALSSFITVGAYSGWVIFQADAVTTTNAETGAYVNEPLLYNDSNESFGVTLRNNAGTYTVQVWHFGNDATYKAAEAVFTLSIPQLVQFHYDGTNIWVRVNSGAPVTRTHPNLAGVTGTLAMGGSAHANANVTVWDAELCASTRTLTDQNNIKAALNTLHGTAF